MAVCLSRPSSCEYLTAIVFRVTSKLTATASVLVRWEQMGDPLADRFIARENEASIPAAPRNVIDQLHEALQDSKADSQTSLTARAFAARPPRGAGVLSSEWYDRRDQRISRSKPTLLQDESSRSFEDLIPHDELRDTELAARRQLERETRLKSEDSDLSAEELHHELEEEERLLKLGQDVFYKFSGGILLALLHFSLAGGFASPRLTSILKKTAYLVPSHQSSSSDASQEKLKEQQKRDGDKTWRRLIETTQWVLDVMEDSSALNCSAASSHPIDSETPASSNTFGGRGRHATLQVRFLHARVRQRVRSLPESPGVVPLNQTDLLATLLSFSTAPLAALSRMGLSLTNEEQEAYLGVWRYVGWLMGVDDRLIRRCLATPTTADRALWSSVENLFNEDQLKTMKPPTYSILQSIADRPPFHTTFALHCALTTSLVGQSLSDALGLPKPSLLVRFKVWTTYLGMWFTTTFGALYPRTNWERERLRVSRTLLRRLIEWNLGMKRSLFQGHASGDIGLVDIADDGGKALRDVKVYHGLMREMIAVYVILGLAASYAGFKVLQATLT